MNKPQMEPEKGEKAGRKSREERKGGEKNQFSQTEAGWSNGGLKEEEEEERTYFPPITSYRLSGKPWKLAWLQPVALLVRPFPGRYGAALLPTPAAIELWAGEDGKTLKMTKQMAKSTSEHFCCLSPMMDLGQSSFLLPFSISKLVFVEFM